MGADLDIFNSLFWDDTLPFEMKFKAEFNYISQERGILIVNLPLF